MGKILVTSTSAQYVPADPSSRVSIAHARGSSVYYDNTSGVSSGTKDGTLEAGGAAVTFEAGVYLKSAGTSYVWVEDVDELDGRDLATQAELDASAGERTTGPASATDGNLPSFDGETGKKLKDSGVLSSSVVLNTGDQTITAPSKTKSALILKGAASQEEPLLKLVDSAGNVAAKFYATVAPELFNGLTLVDEAGEEVAPELNFHGKNGAWFIGMDVANEPKNRDFVLAGKRSQDRESAFDLIYIKDTDEGASEKPALVGFGVTPPSTTKYNRWQFTAVDSAKTLGTIGIRVGPEQTGNVLTVYDSGGTDKVWLTAAYRFKGEGGVKFQAVGTEGSDDRVLTMTNSTASNEYGFKFSDGHLSFRNFTGGVEPLRLMTSGALILGYAGGKVGFFGFEGATIQEVGGAATENLASVTTLVNKLRAAMIAYVLVKN